MYDYLTKIHIRGEGGDVEDEKERLGNQSPLFWTAGDLILRAKGKEG